MDAASSMVLARTLDDNNNNNLVNEELSLKGCQLKVTDNYNDKIDDNKDSIFYDNDRVINKSYVFEICVTQKIGQRFLPVTLDKNVKVIIKTTLVDEQRPDINILESNNDFATLDNELIVLSQNGRAVQNITFCEKSKNKHLIKFEILNHPNVPYFLSKPFRILDRKFAFISTPKELDEQDGKWYKDEGGRYQCMYYECVVQDETGKSLNFINPIVFYIKLVYTDNKSNVITNNSNERLFYVPDAKDTTIYGEKKFVLSSNSGTQTIRFRINELSSQHKKRVICLHFALMIKNTNDAFGFVFLVISSKNIFQR